MALASRQKYQRKPLTLNLNLGKNYVEQVREHRVLGVVTDDELKWQPQIVFKNNYPRTYFCVANPHTTWTVTPVKYFSKRIYFHT